MKEGLNKILEKSKRADFCIGYFNLRGWTRLYELSKHIIDETDKILAKYYGFTEDEFDYIVNYDIKYRMSKALFGEDEAESEDE